MHPHYYPVYKDCWAVSKDDGANWKVSDQAPFIGKVRHAARYMAGLSDGGFIRFKGGYIRGTMTPIQPAVSKFAGRADGQSIWTVDAPWDGNAYLFDIEPLTTGGFLGVYYSAPSSGKPGYNEILKGTADGKQWHTLSTLSHRQFDL